MSERVAIERVGAPGRAWLELRGSVLIYEKQTWVAAATTYIPIEWIAVENGVHRDLRFLWRGILALLVAVLFALPLSLFVSQRAANMLAGMVPAKPLAFTLVALLFVALMTAAIFLNRYARPRPIFRLIPHDNPLIPSIVFWRHGEQDAALEALIGRLKALRQRAPNEAPQPVRMNHSWRKTHPWRLALLNGFGLGFVMLTVLLPVEIFHQAGFFPSFSHWSYLALAVPMLVSCLAILPRQIGLWRQPKPFRDAVHAQRNGDLSAARACLEDLLKNDPKHAAGRFLLIRLLAEQGDVTAALKMCAPLDDEFPFEINRLRGNLLELQRIFARMEE